MHKLGKILGVTLAAVLGVTSATAAPKAVGSSYDIAQTDDDNGCDILMAESDNILRGKTPTYDDSGHTDGCGFYETQTTDFGCVTDGKIPYHRYNGNWDDRWESRALLPQGSKLEWTWDAPENLANVRIFTQWPDGWRTDVSIRAIEVKIGENWTTLANSAFDFAHFADLNTVQPHQEGLHNRMVTFADENSALNLAQNVTGLRITFGNQSNNICYGCYWEIEAKRGEEISFVVKNTVNENTVYTGKGEVQIASMFDDPSCNLYQVTVNGAMPADDDWLAYTAGTIPEDIITFDLPQTLDAMTSFDLYLKGDTTPAYKVGTATIKSAIGAEPTVGTKGGVTVILPNEVDGVTVTRDQILALDASNDSYGGIVSVEAEDTVVDAENSTVSFTVTNLGGTSKVVEVPVTIIPSKGPLPQDYLKLMLHLGSVYKTDDFKLSAKGKDDDYLVPFGGETHQLAYAGQVCDGVETSDGCTTPGKLIWTPMMIDGESWTEGNSRDNYVKYWQLYVNSPTDRDITWRQKSDDSMWVWVNGELQSNNDYTGDYLNFDGHLSRGLNIITIKFYEQGGGDYMSVAIRQRGGNGYFGDLTYQLNPDFMVQDAETGDFYKLTSGAVKVAFLPKVKGAAKYQIVQNDFMGTVQPTENGWLDYVPGEWTTDPIPCTLSTDGEAAYYTVFFQSEDGEVTEGPTASIKTGVVCLGDTVAVGAVAAPVGDGEYALTFTESGKLELAKDLTADILLVGGGGGGGTLIGGGGGGGGVVYRQGVTLKRGTYDVTVGEGGIGATPDGLVAAANGGDSIIGDLIANGGGAGGGSGYTAGIYDGTYAGGNGATGGGVAGHRPFNNINDYYVGSGMEGQGFAGGQSIQHENNDYNKGKGASGGGGGAGEVGQDAYQAAGESDIRGGNGGDGMPCSITGAEVVYGGGGGGGSNYYYHDTTYAALGGAGGGGYGGWMNSGSNAGMPGQDGVDGLGGGGGGGGLSWNYDSTESQSAVGGKGGRGTVIIRFRQTFADDSKVGQGGEMTKKDGWMIHKFTTSGKFTIPNSVIGQVLLVGGGGGGGNGYGAAGGGGGGGMLVVESAEIPAGNYEIIVGQGGLGGIRGREDGANGGDSIFAGWKAVGGGGGAGLWTVHGFAGGSGGGAYSMTLMNNRGDYNGGAAIEGQGFPGGSSTLNNDDSDQYGSGGGGASEEGSSSSTDAPGKGGDGRMCDYSGEEVWYAGGGAGGGNANKNWHLYAEGGQGGGGFGGYWPNGGNADGDSVVGDGVDGLGGGGGGGAMWGNGNLQGRGGNGGSGIVIIRYKLRPAGFSIFLK